MDPLDHLQECDNIALIGPELTDIVDPQDYTPEQLAAGQKLTLAMDEFSIKLSQRLLIEKLQARILRIQRQPL